MTVLTASPNLDKGSNDTAVCDTGSENKRALVLSGRWATDKPEVVLGEEL